MDFAGARAADSIEKAEQEGHYDTETEGSEDEPSPDVESDCTHQQEPNGDEDSCEFGVYRIMRNGPGCCSGAHRLMR